MEEDFVQFLAQRRRSLGLTQEQLAQQIHVTGKAVSKWECGGGLPDVNLLVPLAAALGVTVDELLKGQIAPPPEDRPEALWKQWLRAVDWRRLAVVLAALLPAILWFCPFQALRNSAAELAWRSGFLLFYLAGAVFLLWTACLWGRDPEPVPGRKMGWWTAISLLLALPTLALDGVLVLTAYHAWPALPLAGRPVLVGQIFRMSGYAAGVGMTLWFLFLLYRAQKGTPPASAPLLLGSLYAIVVLFGMTSSMSLDGSIETILRTCGYAASLWLEGLLLSVLLMCRRLPRGVMRIQ